jgi:hypothetical protein
MIFAIPRALLSLMVN